MPKTMNKAELIDAVADLDRTLEGRRGTLRGSVFERITGSLRAATRGARRLRHLSREAACGPHRAQPAHGASIQIARRSKVAGFKAGKALKDAVN
jgi:nucleoid DNA-binding protein